jgi:hypothetical protein
MARIVKRAKKKTAMTPEDFAKVRRVFHAAAMAVLKEKTGLTEPEIMERAKKSGAAAAVFFAELKQILTGGK